MDYKKECPYCHKVVHKMTVPYSQEYNIYGYYFFCDCRNSKEDVRSNEYAAYRVYLEEREKSNLTNFDK